MKMTGFTLAEVLVTLGIIGVVAALTTPALINNTGNAQIGPKLRKARAVFENATQMMLLEENANTILGIALTPQELGTALSRYMKITPCDRYAINRYHGDGAVSYSSDGKFYQSDDGMVYWLENSNRKTTPYDLPDIPHNQTIGDVFVDINASQGPNRMGKDVFNFVLMNDGSLEPMGTSRSWLRSGSFNPSYVPWRDHSEKCNKDNVTGGFFCAGSIFDNGMKIIYQ